MRTPTQRIDDPLGYRLWSPTLLSRLLGQHGLGALTTDLPTLWRSIAARPAEYPVTLFDALYQVRELSDDGGHEELIQGMGGPLFARDAAGLPPRDVALLAYLDHRELFTRVRGRRAIAATRRFREFRGRQLRPMELPGPEVVTRLEEQLGVRFQRRNRSRHCRIHAYALDGLHHFDIHHGRPRLRDAAVDERGRELQSGEVEYRPEQVDRASYDPAKGLLRVTARDMRTIRSYCEVFGLELFGAKDWFADATILTFEPLLDDAAGALRPTRGIKDVRLVSAQISCGGRIGMELVFRSKDVLAAIAEHGGVGLQDGRLTWVGLSVTYAHGGVRVTRLGLPNQVTYDNHRDEPVIRCFLEERGFLCGPLRFHMAS